VFVISGLREPALNQPRVWLFLSQCGATPMGICSGWLTMNQMATSTTALITINRLVRRHMLIDP
jgi:hypothetical protein